MALEGIGVEAGGAVRGRPELRAIAGGRGLDQLVVGRRHSPRDSEVRRLLLAADLVALHPEYHALLDDPEAALAGEWTPEGGETNPFLHLSLHLAVEEQLSIDQPPGLRPAFEALLARRGERHAALHEALECLGETLWRAEKSRSAPDGEAYVECVRRRGGK